MTNVYEGMLDAKGLKFGIVSSRFNSFITEKLVEGAVDTIIRLFYPKTVQTHTNQYQT